MTQIPPGAEVADIQHGHALVAAAVLAVAAGGALLVVKVE